MPRGLSTLFTSVRAKLDKWWPRYKNVAAFRGLLQWLGWWGTWVATVSGVMAWLWSHLSHLRGPEQFALALIVFLAVLGILYLWPSAIAKLKRKSTQTRSDPEPSLLSLMDSSFPNLNKLWGKPELHFEDGMSLQLTSALYFDLFTSGAKFLGFHVPRSPRALEVFAVVAERATELGDALGSGGLMIVCKAPGENPQTVSDLKYSGKVYLYHEDALTHKQMAEVEEMFRNQQLTVVLRGPDFLAQAWVAWKQKSLAPK